MTELNYSTTMKINGTELLKIRWKYRFTVATDPQQQQHGKIQYAQKRPTIFH